MFVDKKSFKFFRLVIFSANFLSTSLAYALDLTLSCKVQSTYTYHYVLSSEVSVEKNDGIAFVDIQENKKYKSISISSTISELDNLLAVTRHPNLDSVLDNSDSGKWDIDSVLVSFKEGARRESQTKIVVNRNSGEILVQSSSKKDNVIRSETSAFGFCEKIGSKKKF
jgi:hypothetical protein